MVSLDVVDSTSVVEELEVVGAAVVVGDEDGAHPVRASAATATREKRGLTMTKATRRCLSTLLVQERPPLVPALI